MRDAWIPFRGRGLLVALAIALGGASPAAQAAEEPAGRSTIRVVGEAKVVAKPDIAELDVGVVSQAKTAAAAGADNAKKLDRVVSGLKKALGPNADVQTVAYMAVPNYTDPGRGQSPKIDSYTVTNVVRARIRDVAGVGKIVDLSLQLGANEVQRLAFMLADEQPAQNQALKAAATKARAQANALAAALGVRIVRIVNVSENGPMSSPVMFADAKSRAEASGVSTPIEPGTIEIRASVTATYEIDGASR